MSKRSKPAAKQPRWRISRIKSTPAAELGTVTAPDAEKRHRESNRGISDH
jgi:hypothetical protein